MAATSSEVKRPEDRAMLHLLDDLDEVIEQRDDLGRERDAWKARSREHVRTFLTEHPDLKIREILDLNGVLEAERDLARSKLERMSVVLHKLLEEVEAAHDCQDYYEKSKPAERKPGGGVDCMSISNARTILGSLDHPHMVHTTVIDAAALVTVEVRDMGDGIDWRLIVNGCGIAKWSGSESAVSSKDVPGKDYAEEVARCLRVALGGAATADCPEDSSHKGRICGACGVCCQCSVEHSIDSDEFNDIRARITDIADDLLGLQVPGTTPIAMLDAIEARANTDRIDAGSADAALMHLRTAINVLYARLGDRADDTTGVVRSALKQILDRPECKTASSRSTEERFAGPEEGFVVLTIYREGDPELTCLICGQLECDEQIMALLDPRTGQRRRVWWGKHSNCSFVESKHTPGAPR